MPKGEQLLPAQRAGSQLRGDGRGRTGLVLAFVEKPVGILIVVENSADPPGLTPVLQEEILIAPGLEHLVQIRMHRITGRLMRAMEMTSVVEERVIGSEISTATEPPHRAGLEVAVVEMHSGDVGISGVQNHRGSGGEPGMPLGFRPLLEDRGRQLLSLHLGEVHSTLLKHTPLTHHPGASPSTFRTHPRLLDETPLTIESLQTGTDLVLKTGHHGSGPLAGIGWRTLQRSLRGSRRRAPGTTENALKQAADHGSDGFGSVNLNSPSEATTRSRQGLSRKATSRIRAHQL